MEEVLDRYELFVRRFRANDSGCRTERDERWRQARGGDELCRSLIAKNGMEAVLPLIGQLAAGSEQAAVVAEIPALRPLEDFAPQRSLTLDRHAVDAVDRVPQGRIRIEIGMHEHRVECHRTADRHHAAI